jgi:hypothetical protein
MAVKPSGPGLGTYVLKTPESKTSGAELVWVTSHPNKKPRMIIRIWRDIGNKGKINNEESCVVKLNSTCGPRNRGGGFVAVVATAVETSW